MCQSALRRLRWRLRCCCWAVMQWRQWQQQQQQHIASNRGIARVCTDVDASSYNSVDARMTLPGLELPCGLLTVRRTLYVQCWRIEQTTRVSRFSVWGVRLILIPSCFFSLISLLSFFLLPIVKRSPYSSQSVGERYWLPCMWLQRKADIDATWLLQLTDLSSNFLVSHRAYDGWSKASSVIIDWLSWGLASYSATRHEVGHFNDAVRCSQSVRYTTQWRSLCSLSCRFVFSRI